MKVQVSQNMILSITLAILLAFPAALQGGRLLGPVLYEYQMSKVETGPGSVGSAALEDTPVATSIADMKKMERFTLLVNSKYMTYSISSRRWGEDVYWTVDLPSGETVAVLMNKDAVTPLFESETIYEPDTLLPIGRWVKWSHTGEERKQYSYFHNLYTDFSHYVDMRGDLGNMPRLSEVQISVTMPLFYFFIFFFLWLIRHYGVKWGLLKRVVFDAKSSQIADETIPRDDTERWFIATYAIWNKRYGSADLIAGIRKTYAGQESIRRILGRDWEINSAQDGIDTILELSQPPCFNRHNKSILAWNYCRAMQLLGCFFVAGYIDRQTMREQSCLVGRLIQSEFSSWEELCTNYLAGFMWWRQAGGIGARRQVRIRCKIFKKLMRRRDSPYSIPFDLALNEAPLPNEQTDPSASR